jgi:hypothetical protein
MCINVYALVGYFSQALPRDSPAGDEKIKGAETVVSYLVIWLHSFTTNKTVS